MLSQRIVSQARLNLRRQYNSKCPPEILQIHTRDSIGLRRIYWIYWTVDGLNVLNYTIVNHRQIHVMSVLQNELTHVETRTNV